MGLQVRTGVIFVAENRLQRPFAGLLQLFALSACFPLQDCPESAIRDPTEYCLWIPYGDPVRIRNNRPLLCFSQRAYGVHWVFHALTGECSLV